jgi:TonB family protein
MGNRLKKILGSRFEFRQAVLIAILLHLLLFLIPDFQKLLVPNVILQSVPDKIIKPEDLKFKFVEVPNDKSEPNPDSRVFSDKDRRASTLLPSPEKDALPEPRSKGETPEAMLSRSDLNRTRPTPDMREGKPDIKEEIGRETEADKPDIAVDINSWMRFETADEKEAKRLANEMKRYETERNLSIRDLNKYFKFQDFNNPSSSLLREGGIQFDTKGFDFGRWIKDFYYKVYSNWIIPLAFETLRRSGQLTLRFYVHRDGSVSGLELLDSSGLEPYDDAALSAIVRSNPFLPLPEGYPDEKMEVTCRFIYRWNPQPNYHGGRYRRYR